MVSVRCYGLVGSLRVWSPEVTVVESKPDFPITDLRIVNPFPELESFAAAFDLGVEDSMEHAHIPWVVILVQGLAKWKEAHGGRVPETGDEKRAFRASVQALSRDFEKEENFREAYDATLKSLNRFQLPDGAREVLTDPKSDPAALTKDSSDFWIMAAAVRQFRDAHPQGLYPLPGSVPDMTATTESFVGLQRVYHAAAEADIAAVLANVASLQAVRGKAAEAIPEEDVRLFCKNIANLRVARYRSLAEELDPSAPNKNVQAAFASSDMGIEDGPFNNAVWYLLLRAVDKYQLIHGRYPGLDEGSLDDDFVRLKSVTVTLLAQHALPAATVPDEAIREMVRFGAAQIHNVAAVMGGIASQEIIKLITKQFTPMSHTVIFNAIECTTSTYSF